MDTTGHGALCPMQEAWLGACLTLTLMLENWDIPEFIPVSF